MTLLSELQALAEKWRQEANECQHTTDACLEVAYDHCADELTELLGKVVVTDEMVKVAVDADYNKLHALGQGYSATIGMRAALESVLGVTK